MDSQQSEGARAREKTEEEGHRYLWACGHVGGARLTLVALSVGSDMRNPLINKGRATR